MPTSGPYITLRGWPYNGDRTEYLRRYSYRQSPIGRLKLPYDSTHTLRVKSVGANYLVALDAEAEHVTGFEDPSRYGRYVVSANNAALARLKEQIAEFSQQGENLGQASKSMKMVTDRIGQVFRSYKALRKGRFGDFIETLRIPAQAKDRRFATGTHKRVARNASSIFLEYTYGWKPIVQDIFVGLNAIVDAPQNEKRPIKARASSGKFPLWLRPGRVISGYGRYDVDLRAVITVTDENLFTLNRTGLVNPATIAWQLLPFSFIADWFVNVEQFINSLSDYAGLTVTNPSTSTRSYAESEEYENGVSPPQRASFVSYGLRRQLTLPVVVLAPKLDLSLSVQHGKVAIALLTGLFVSRDGIRNIRV